MVNKIFSILLIILLLTYNVGFCADTYVNFNQTNSNAFYVWFTSINTNLTNIYNRLLNLPNAISNINTYIPSIYNKLDAYISYLYDIYTNNNNYSLAENYILNEQDNLQDYFIKILETNDDLKTIFKNTQSLQVYAHMNAPYANNVIYIFYNDNVDHNTYQSNPYNNVLQHKSFAVPNVNKTLYLDVVTSQISWEGYITYNKRSGYVEKNLSNTGTWVIPTCCLDYKSENFTKYLNALRGLDTEITAQQETTQAIKDSTDRILSEQSDTITDTGVTDSSSDNSPNLQSTFNTMSSAFTTRNTSTKTFVFTLPNGQSYNFTLANNLLTNMLSSYGSVFYSFYQAIFWCIFGGYVLFDFKRIINKFKGGDIDSVVSSSSPIDNVVKASLG